MSEDVDQLEHRRRAVAKLVPLLEAIGGIGEIAYRRAAEGIAPAQSYAAAVRDQLDRLCRSQGFDDDSLWPTNPERPRALLLIASERGLCGRFNHRLAEQTLEEVRKGRRDGLETDVLVLGERGAHSLQELGIEPVYRAAMPSLARPTYLDAERVALDILDLVEQGAYRSLDVLHARPAGRFDYELAIHRLLPPEPSNTTTQHGAPAIEVKPADDVQQLLARLVSERVLADLYEMMVQSVVSEQLARVFAMRLAVENAGELLDRLDVEYNAARQQQVTRDLSEVIGAFQAVEETGWRGAVDV